ncbi:MAG: arginine transporter [Pseudomonadota bacterium]
MRFVVFIITVAALASCGGSSNRAPAGIQFAQGPISRACLAADRRAASQALCECVQAVANSELSAREQSRAAEFFADPQAAQDTRQSDNPGSERFWTRYRAFADRAEQTCRPVA